MRFKRRTGKKTKQGVVQMESKRRYDHEKTRVEDEKEVRRPLCSYLKILLIQQVLLFVLQISLSSIVPHQNRLS